MSFDSVLEEGDIFVGLEEGRKRRLAWEVADEVASVDG